MNVGKRIQLNKDMFCLQHNNTYFLFHYIHTLLKTKMRYNKCPKTHAVFYSHKGKQGG